MTCLYSAGFESRVQHALGEFLISEDEELENGLG